MKPGPVATIINFCTNEARFLKDVIEQARFFSDQIIIPHSDHFFDGTPENSVLLGKIHRSFPDVRFIQYPFPHNGSSSRIWHSVSRKIGAHFLDVSIETILFLDADEIPDGPRFAEILQSEKIREISGAKISAYWYFREPSYRATTHEEAGLLLDRTYLSHEILLHEGERDALFAFLPEAKDRRLTGPDGLPLVHHYSWARTETEMLKKVSAWGHNKDLDWVSLVREEFSRPFQGRDFVHGYSYETVTPPFETTLKEDGFPANLPSTAEILTPANLRSILSYDRI